MTTSPEGGPSYSHDYLNQRAAELSETQAYGLRKQAITLTHEVFSVFLRDDATLNTGYLDLDFLASPGLTQDEYKDALTYKLVRTKPRAPGDDFGADRIQMYLPVPSDFHLGQHPSDLPELDEVSEVYVKFEKDRADGVHIRRFVIDLNEGVYEYVTEIDPDHEAEASDILDREIHHFSTDTQNLNMLMLAQLLEDHRNFSAISQNAGE